MQCNFTLKHYEEILDLARDKGYSFCSFFEKPKGKVIYLRHDIDIALDRALVLAKLESKKNIRATYFIQLDCPFYNPLEEKVASRISSLGHDVGLHYTKGIMEEQVEILNAKKLVSFHKPSKEVLGKKIKGFVSAYEPYFFEQVKYIADSKMAWKEECACKILGKYPKLQILIHPIWWQDSFSNPMDILNDYLKKYPVERQEELKEYLKKNIKSYQL